MKKRIFAGLASALCLSLLAASPQTAEAATYTFTGDVPGVGVFYQSTDTSTDYLAENDRLVVGIDGVTQGEAFFPADPLPSIDLPVGVYPDAFGTMTDIAIAQNTVFMNEAGPSTQTLNNFNTIYLPYTIPSGALTVGGLYDTPVQTVYPTTLTGGGATNFITGSTTDYATDGTYGTYSTYGAYGTVSGADIPKLTGTAIAKLSIPSLNVNHYVYEGATDANMLKGIGHFDSTPAWGGNIALCGHNNPSQYAFYYLRNAATGMTCTYTTAYGTMTYVITSVEQVSKYDTTGLMQDGTNKLTLYTCVEGQADYRIKVVAHAVA